MGSAVVAGPVGTKLDIDNGMAKFGVVTVLGDLGDMLVGILAVFWGYLTLEKLQQKASEHQTKQKTLEHPYKFL